MTLSRRSALKAGLGAGAVLLLDRLPAFGEVPTFQQQGPILKKAIPRTKEMLPVIGLGGLQLNQAPTSAVLQTTKDTIQEFYNIGGRVIDTAPGYTNSEKVVGDAITEFGHNKDYFIATKFNALQLLAGNTVGVQIRLSGGEAADKAEMERQFRNSLALMQRKQLDLEQIWNLGDTQPHAQASSESAGMLPWHLDKALEWKKAGLTRYIGITTSRDPQYGELEQAIRKKEVDFIQLDMSVGDPVPEERLLPACLDTGTAVLVNRPFGTGALFTQATQRQKTIPPWAAEIGITSWAQYFLKYIVSHPAVTAAIPSTDKLDHLHDNMGACFGTMPDAAMRKRMLDYWNAA